MSNIFQNSIAWQTYSSFLEILYFWYLWIYSYCDLNDPRLRLKDIFLQLWIEPEIKKKHKQMYIITLFIVLLYLTRKDGEETTASIPKVK